MAKEIKDRQYLEKLRNVVAYHQRKYHKDDAPELSDQAYDALVRELSDLEKEFGEQKQSVAEAVGYAPSAAFTKVKHQVRQWSFDNVFDFTELKAWEQKLLRYLNKEGVSDQKSILRGRA